MTLLTSAEDQEHSHAAILRDLLGGVKKPPSTSGPARAASAGRDSRTEATMIFRSNWRRSSPKAKCVRCLQRLPRYSKNAAVSDWYVTQPDHARISGELAAAFDSRKVPNVSEAIVRAISMHDLAGCPTTVT